MVIEEEKLPLFLENVGELGLGSLAFELALPGVAKLRNVRFFGSILLLFPHRRIGITKKSLRSFGALKALTDKTLFCPGFRRSICSLMSKFS